MGLLPHGEKDRMRAVFDTVALTPALSQGERGKILCTI